MIPTSLIHPLLVQQQHLLRRSQRRVLRTRLHRAPPRSQLQRYVSRFNFHFCAGHFLIKVFSQLVLPLHLYSPLEAHPLALPILLQTVLQLLLALPLQLIHPHLLKAQLLLLQRTRQRILLQATRLLLPQALPPPLLQATPQRIRLLHLWP